MYTWVFPKIVVPPNGWFLRENPIKIDDLGVFFFGNIHIFVRFLFFHSGFAWLISQVCCFWGKKLTAAFGSRFENDWCNGFWVKN